MNHLFCARCSPQVLQGWWFAICEQWASVPSRLATVSTWADGHCSGCDARTFEHDGVECLIVSLGYVTEEELAGF